MGSPAWHLLDDDALLAQCEVQAHRASGPGGQHRNKSETAIRLVHGPSGVSAEGKDERSRAQNLRIALGRLREKLARRAYRPPPRRPTKPTRGSRERRAQDKRLHSQKKAARRGSFE
ncbi:MAG TPA: peptide chain release factor-like protein [Myxococcales bacterium]|nr:peptide chain release factor-like protein [Myxococcales bacterium]